MIAAPGSSSSLKINYTPDRDSSLSHLKTTYHKYLADLFAPQTEAVELAKPSEE
jgi:hypothetical protein